MHFLQFLENEEDLDLLFLKFEEVEHFPKLAIQKILDHLEYDLDLTTKEREKILNVRSIKDEGEGDNAGDI